MKRLFLAATALALVACNDEELARTPAPEPLGPRPQESPAATQNGAQRLTIAQYANTVHDLFGADIVVPKALEPDTTLDGFVAIGASVSTVSHRGVEQYEEAAYAVAKQVLASGAARAAAVPCEATKADDAACAAQIASTLGRRVYRRPLTQPEADAVRDVITKAGAALGTFDAGVEFGIAALLQSPSFLYRAAPGEVDAATGERRYTGFEMASRLSFFLWDTTPDDALLDAAAAGRLTSNDGLAAEVERMLASPKTRAGLRSFVTQWLGLEKLDALSKDPKLFTYFSPEVGPAAREETLLGFERLFDEDADFRDAFTTGRTFVDAKLASMYAVPAPAKEGFGEVVFPETSPRRGLLGHASILALYAHPTSSSATLRGKFVRTTLLCGTIPPPPVDVNTALPEPTGTAVTLRDRVKEHLTDPACSGCHLRMDPIGLGLETFDGLGIHRTKDHGALIDASGDVDGVHFEDARELGAVVRDNPGLVPCFVNRMWEYATGFIEKPAEHATLDVLTHDFRASGHTMRSLMRAIATSPSFRLAGAPR